MNRPTATQSHQQKPTATPVVSGLLQRQCACGNHTVAGGECEACSKKQMNLQRRAVDNRSEPSEAPPIVHDVLRSPGQPLDPATRAFFELRFGHDFSQVRVHNETKAEESAQAVGAVAYSVGQHVVIPERLRFNHRVLAHELAHVAASGSTYAQSQPARLEISRPGAAEEVAAEEVAQRVLAHNTGSPEPAQPISQAPPGRLFRLTGLGCGKERMPMNFNIIGVFEHTLIEQDYEAKFNPSAEREYSIPGGNCRTGSMGWADIVEPDKRTVYEIKPDTPSGLRDGKSEAECYVMMASDRCGGKWSLGTNYYEHKIMTSGQQELWARLAESGLILYEWRRRSGLPAPETIWILVLMLMLAALKAAAKETPKKAGGPIIAAIQLLATAAVIVLSEQQAKAGEKNVDEDPLVALAQMLDDTGHPMPPGIRKLLEENPELRELLRIEIETRRRSGARLDTPGRVSGTPPTAPSNGGSASDKAALEPKPTPSDRKATAPALGGIDFSLETQRPGADAATGYWQSAQQAMNNFDWSQLRPNKVQLVWPPGVHLATLMPKEEMTTFSFGRSGAARYVFGISVEFLGRAGPNTFLRVTWCGGILTHDGKRLAPPLAYKPGTVFTAHDHRE